MESASNSSDIENNTPDPSRSPRISHGRDLKHILPYLITIFFAIAIGAIVLIYGLNYLNRSDKSLSNQKLDDHELKIATIPSNLQVIPNFIKLSEGSISTDQQILDDSSKIATISSDLSVVQDGVTAPDGILSTFAISPDYNHVLYMAKLGSKYVCVVDNIIGKAYEKISKCMFGPSYSEPVYIVSSVIDVDPTPRGCKSFSKWPQECIPNYIDITEDKVVIGLEEGKAYSHIYNVVVDHNSNKIAYNVCDKYLGNSCLGNEFVVIGDQEGKKYSSILFDEISFIDDGQLKYYACPKGVEPLGYNCDETDTVVVVGSNETLLNLVRSQPELIYSSDKKHSVYVQSSTSKSTVILDDKIIASYGPNDVILYDPIFSGNSEKLAYVVCNNFYSTPGSNECRDGAVVVTFDILTNTLEQGKSYSNVEKPFFTPDSSNIAYIICTDFRNDFCFGQQSLVVGSVEGKRYPSVSDVVFTQDAKHVAFIVCGNVMVESVDNATGGESCQYESSQYFVVFDNYEGKRYTTVSNPIISPDGNHIAYIACNSTKDIFGNCIGKKFIVLGSDEEEAYDNILSLNFSPDSKTIVAAVVDGSKRYMVIGNRKGKAYEKISGPLFNKDGKSLQFIGILGNDILKVTQQIP